MSKKGNAAVVGQEYEERVAQAIRLILAETGMQLQSGPDRVPAGQQEGRDIDFEVICPFSGSQVIWKAEAKAGDTRRGLKELYSKCFQVMKGNEVPRVWFLFATESEVPFAFKEAVRQLAEKGFPNGFSIVVFDRTSVNLQKAAAASPQLQELLGIGPHQVDSWTPIQLELHAAAKSGVEAQKRRSTQETMNVFHEMGARAIDSLEQALETEHMLQVQGALGMAEAYAENEDLPPSLLLRYSLCKSRCEVLNGDRQRAAEALEAGTASLTGAAGELYLRSRRAHLDNDIPRAMQLVGQYLDVVPDSEGARRHYALLLATSGDHEEALNILRESRTLACSFVRLLVHMDRKDWRTALLEIEGSPDLLEHPRANSAGLSAFIQLNFPPDALFVLGFGHPPFAELARGLCDRLQRQLLEQGRVARSYYDALCCIVRHAASYLGCDVERSIEEAARRFSPEEEGVRRQVKEYQSRMEVLMQGSDAQGLSELIEESQANGFPAVAFSAEVNLALLHNNYEKAISLLEMRRLAALPGERSGLTLNLGRIKARAGDVSGAVAEFESLSWEDANLELIEEYVRLICDAKGAQDAAAAAERFIRAGKSTPLLYGILLQYLADAAKHLSRAISVAEDGLLHFPDDPALLYYAARTATLLLPAKARSYLARAARVRLHARNHAQLGICAIKLREMDLAWEHLLHALRQAPYDPVVCRAIILHSVRSDDSPSEGMPVAEGTFVRIDVGGDESWWFLGEDSPLGSQSLPPSDEVSRQLIDRCPGDWVDVTPPIRQHSRVRILAVEGVRTRLVRHAFEALSSLPYSVSKVTSYSTEGVIEQIQDGLREQVAAVRTALDAYNQHGCLLVLSQQLESPALAWEFALTHVGPRATVPRERVRASQRIIARGGPVVCGPFAQFCLPSLIKSGVRGLFKGDILYPVTLLESIHVDKEYPSLMRKPGSERSMLRLDYAGQVVIENDPPEPSAARLLVEAEEHLCRRCSDAATNVPSLVDFGEFDCLPEAVRDAIEIATREGGVVWSEDLAWTLLPNAPWTCPIVDTATVLNCLPLRTEDYLCSDGRLLDLVMELRRRNRNLPDISSMLVAKLLLIPSRHTLEVLSWIGEERASLGKLLGFIGIVARDIVADDLGEIHSSVALRFLYRWLQALRPDMDMRNLFADAIKRSAVAGSPSAVDVARAFLDVTAI